MTAKNPFRTTLIAPCGMDCAICSAYLREKNRCNGCNAPDRRCNRNCTIASCDQVRNRYRHTCPDFPCRRLKQLDKRYRTKYGMSMLENLAAIRDHGIRTFVEAERDRDVRTPIFAACAKAGYPIVGMKAVDLSLEEIFLNLVTEEPAAPEAAAAAPAGEGA